MLLSYDFLTPLEQQKSMCYDSKDIDFYVSSDSEALAIFLAF